MWRKCRQYQHLRVADKNFGKSLNRRKTLGMPENTGFTGSVVADWLHNIVAKMLPE